MTNQVPLSELKWRCRRGMLELDIFLQKFMQHGYAKLDDSGRNDFYEILEFQDQELVELLLGKVSAMDRHINDIARKIRECAAL
jgi:antitoxin CptB